MSSLSSPVSASAASSSSFTEQMESLLHTYLSSVYRPVNRLVYNPTPQDIEFIRLWLSSVMLEKDSKAKEQNGKEWYRLTKDNPEQQSFIDRAMDICYGKVEEGTADWYRIVHGATDAEYDEMDRVGRQIWEENVRHTVAEGTRLTEEFRALPLDEQTHLYRKSATNAFAWEALISSLTPAEIRGIELRDDEQQEEWDREDYLSYKYDD